MSHTDTLAEILAARQAMIAAADQSYRYGGEAYDAARNRLFSLLDDALIEAPVAAQTPPPQWWSTRWGRRA